MTGQESLFTFSMHKNLRPFFYYYGGKFTLSKRLPRPEHQTLIEPFAGSAGYSLHYHWLRVRLYDIDPVVIGMWNFLISASESEILRLPLVFDSVDDLVGVPEEAKWLIGFWLNKGSAIPKKNPSKWMREGDRPNTFWGDAVRHRLAQQVALIRHWEAEVMSYEDVPIATATWMIDAPYSNQAGSYYRYSSIDFTQLREWTKALPGQKIVCENEGADWLPFRPLHKQESSRGRVSHEVYWHEREDAGKPLCPDCGSPQTTIYPMDNEGSVTLYCDDCKREEHYFPQVKGRARPDLDPHIDYPERFKEGPI